MNICGRFFVSIPCLVVLSVVSYSVFSSAEKPPRERILLTTWQFVEDADASSAPAPPPETAKWKQVAVPHVFRQSGLPDNAAGWYRQTVTLTSTDSKRRIYLMMEGAASVKDVYVNGVFIGRHRGPFSASAFDLTPALKTGQPNTVDVRVSNRDNETQNCFSRSTLYYVNGGMFRKAWLVKTGEVHLFPDMGSSGVYLTPGNITETGADLSVRAVVRNPLASPVEVTVRHSVADPAGKNCLRLENKKMIPAGETMTIDSLGKVDHPKLWDIKRPNRYTVRTEVFSNGRVSDTVTERFGFRTIAFRDNRFYLNGHEVQFRGVNKHAQNEYVWNAVSDDELRREWKSMTELGANMVRLAHYPHSRLEYDIADERGMVVWAENGYAGQLWTGPGNEEKAVTPDGERLTHEMVRQNWNHPSILFWSAGNETILEVAGHYADLIRSERDPSRLVTYAATGDQQLKNCDFVAYNTYDGWYTSGPYTDFTKSRHNDMVSETGSGDWITHHVPYGTINFTVDKYEPEEYSEMFTEYRLQTVSHNDIANHPMFLWWNFREFYNLKFKQNRNTKGLLTLAGMPKDGFFLFKAFFNPTEPVVHLCGRQHFLRAFDRDNGIKAYSNSEELQLTLNGVAREKIRNGSYRLPDAMFKNQLIPGIPVANVFFWKTPLNPGRNVVEVTDGHGHSDRMIIYQQPADTQDPAALVQNLHSSNPANPAYFIDCPVEPQSPVYTDVDGSSDNTFDILPKEIQGAARIATRRMSDPNLRTDLQFSIKAAKGATIFVFFSTGDYPVVTLKKPDPAIKSAADAMRKSLAATGFGSSGVKSGWRDHMLNRAYAEVWSRNVKSDEKVSLPGQTLDYVVMVRAKTGNGGK
jgi:beta-galactosidase